MFSMFRMFFMVHHVVKLLLDMAAILQTDIPYGILVELGRGGSSDLLRVFFNKFFLNH